MSRADALVIMGPGCTHKTRTAIYLSVSAAMLMPLSDTFHHRIAVISSEYDSASMLARIAEDMQMKNGKELVQELEKRGVIITAKYIPDAAGFAFDMAVAELVHLQGEHTMDLILDDIQNFPMSVRHRHAIEERILSKVNGKVWFIVHCYRTVLDPMRGGLLYRDTHNFNCDIADAIFITGKTEIPTVKVIKANDPKMVGDIMELGPKVIAKFHPSAHGRFEGNFDWFKPEIMI